MRRPLRGRGLLYYPFEANDSAVLRSNMPHRPAEGVVPRSAIRRSRRGEKVESGDHPAEAPRIDACGRSMIGATMRPTMTTIRLYDAKMLGDRRPSPFCWRTKYALAHKGLSFETVPVALTEIPTIAGGAYKTVPIIEDGEKTVCDSWVIADYLDEAYPDRPRLFGTPAERRLSWFCDINVLLRAGRSLLWAYVKDVHDHTLEQDRGYFRQSREELFGRTLEEIAAGREEKIQEARAAFDPVRMALKDGGPFILGASPGYVDYAVAGLLLWIAAIATAPLLPKDDPLLPWLSRVQDLYGGLGRSCSLDRLVA